VPDSPALWARWRIPGSYPAPEPPVRPTRNPGSGAVPCRGPLTAGERLSLLSRVFSAQGLSPTFERQFRAGACSRRLSRGFVKQRLSPTFERQFRAGASCHAWPGRSCRYSSSRTVGSVACIHGDRCSSRFRRTNGRPSGRDLVRPPREGQQQQAALLSGLDGPNVQIHSAVELIP
jgi:hypothetical protein